MWVRLDDRFPAHPKVIGLSNLAFRTFVEVLCYSGEYGTGGWVPGQAMVKRRAAVRELVNAGLLSKDGDGYAIHDWTDYNPSAEQMAARRAAARVRAARHRLRAVDPPDDE